MQEEIQIKDKLRKIYVLDTNVLLQSPHALTSFEDNEVILPVTVLEELDKFKDVEGEKGANARAVIRTLDNYRKNGDLINGIKLENGGTLKTIIKINNYIDNVPLPEMWDERKADNKILLICKYLIKYYVEKSIILVTNDILLRLKASSLGIHAEEFTTDRSPELPKQYTGRTEVFINKINFETFKESKCIDISKTYITIENDMESEFPFIEIPELVENQFVIIKNDVTFGTLLGKVKGNEIVMLNFEKETPYGIKPRNVGQTFVQEALMDDEVPLVIIKGPAGTAKTFYSLAVGLHKSYTSKKDRIYRKLLVCRPNAEFDDDIGFLPGDEQEKISPLLRPIRDNLEVLVDRNEESKYNDEGKLSDKVQELFDKQVITAEALNFIRGRSIAKTWIIIDEAQNLTPKQAKGIITRAGQGTKIVMVGDPAQIDNPFLNERNNGLSYASEKMKGSKHCYQITMEDKECERSKLAMDAANRM